MTLYFDESYINCFTKNNTLKGKGVVENARELFEREGVDGAKFAIEKYFLKRLDDVSIDLVLIIAHNIFVDFCDQLELPRIYDYIYV
jgi:hypothetical protein